MSIMLDIPNNIHEALHVSPAGAEEIAMKWSKPAA